MATFTLTNGIGSLLYILGKVSISIVNTLIGHLIISNFEPFKTDID
jgi:hypothetical protein